MGDQDNLGANLRADVHGFSPAVRDNFEQFDFDTQIDRLTKANLLYLVSEKFTTVELHPKNVSNAQMGSLFEEPICKFAEFSNETAGVTDGARMSGYAPYNALWKAPYDAAPIHQQLNLRTDKFTCERVFSTDRVPTLVWPVQ